MRNAAIILLSMLSGAAIAQESEVEQLARGPTRPAQVATLGPIQDGVVRAVKVVEGDRVKRGDLLLQLNDDVQEARIGLTRAAAASDGELRQAEVQAQEAETVLGRTQAAAARNAATEWEVRHARARLESARAAVQAATDRRKVEQQRLELEIATRETLMIRAPFDGIVTRLDTAAGATLSRTDRPIVVSDLSAIEAVLYLPGPLWPRLKLGNTYPLGLSAPVGGKRDGRLRYIEPVLDAASGRFRAIFVIDNQDFALPAGVEATLDFSEVM
ncbi:efflux RND transporter periplasmic adaptor subunit [Bosea sp. BK604]|uniref:efflux RND transporter periplasmic adaptor subunit n=1 Tax=Bosea sp. BK604 TaxID=2512180 RepID=UPI00105354CD|nr:efflux RND transporter periplasmic adaptor subunit [Bosea sp. BK604]TCR65736.1 RND family efflux transporter MFP subunit [Bosea sp. BK604]